MPDLRIRESNLPSIKRGKQVYIHFEGKKLKAYENESLASALYANGIFIFSRSIKFHRPRGYFCGTGRCASCMMEIDNVPHQRACQTKVRENMSVRRHANWINADRDFYNIIDKLSFLFPAGFYYKRFIKPVFLRNFYMNRIVKMSGIGKLPDKTSPDNFKESEYLETDLLIIGGGLSGLVAGLEAAKAGIRVLVIEKDDSLGGMYANNPEHSDYPVSQRKYELIDSLVSDLEKFQNLTVLKNVLGFGIYENCVAASSDTKLYQVKAKKQIIATGNADKSLAFENNDLPNILLISAAKKLVYNDGIMPGYDGTIINLNSKNMEFLEFLQHLNVKLKLVYTGTISAELKDWLKRKDLQLFEECKNLKALGSKKIKRIVFESDGKKKVMNCDFIVIDNDKLPTYELALQYGAMLKQTNSGFALLKTENMEVIPDFYVIGELANARTEEEIIMTAKIAVNHILTSMHIDKEKDLKLLKERYLQIADKSSIVSEPKKRVMVQ